MKKKQVNIALHGRTYFVNYYFHVTEFENISLVHLRKKIYTIAQAQPIIMYTIESYDSH